MLFDLLVQASRRVAGIPGRLAKVDILATLLKQAKPEEVETVIAYLSGSLRQSKIGVGWATLRAAQAEAAGAPTIDIAELHATLDQIAAASGKGSTSARTQLLKGLFARATADEQEFLFRLLTGELRQGALAGIMTEAVARAAGLAAADVRRAAMIAGDLGVVARMVLTEGAAGLGQFQVQLFRPVQPMLAQTATDVSEALDRLGSAAFEFKLDGARIQVHKRGEDIQVFSRLLNDVTVAVPEVIATVRRLELKEAILDGEAIALSPTGQPLPFQTTMRRFGRKLDVQGLQGELPLTSFFFDVIYADGASLLAEPYTVRYDTLARYLPESQRIPRIVTGEAGEAQSFFDSAIAAGHEGLMAKSLQAAYEAGGRGWSWMKIKQANTLDLVVLAAEWGHGRRQGWLSNLHLGARNPEGGFVMLGKTFKGMTDEMLEWQTKKLLDLQVGSENHVVFVRPELVVEIAFNGLQESSHYPGGLALRFARVIRYREDKKPSEADTIETVKRLAQVSAA